jgi:hypothetical protein
MTASTPTAIPATQRMIVIQRTMRVLSEAESVHHGEHGGARRDAETREAGGEGGFAWLGEIMRSKPE